MKIKLLIATTDSDYTDHLSNILSEKYSETFEVSVCSSAERLSDLLSANRYDTGLIEPEFASVVGLSSIHLLLILLDESEPYIDIGKESKKIRKYQRVSLIAGEIMENYAVASKGVNGFNSNKARITAVWSPSGGSGKTTVALAYAAYKVSNNKQAVYLNLENFSSTSAYFKETGKSISKVFEKLEINVNLFLKGIRQRDGGSGVSYFCGPENYDDINILTLKDVETLINACAAETDELVIDLSSQCDERVRKVFEISDTVLLTCEPSITSQMKLQQFINQHNVFGQIQAKAILVNNKGAKTTETKFKKTVQLPLIHSVDPVSIFKSLSSGNFDW